MSGLIGLSQKKNGIVNHFTSLGIDDNATSNAVTIDGSENVTITDGAHDFDIASHDASNGLKLGGTLVAASASELNTAADGSTSVGTTAVAGTDGFVTNDAGTMRQTSVATLDTYLSASTKTLTNKTLTSPVIGDLSNFTGSLPSGVTGGSGLDAVSAGKVLSMGSTIAAPQSTSSTTSWDFKSSTVLTFTPTVSTSNVFITATFSMYMAGGFCYFDIYKNASDFTETYNLSGNTNEGLLGANGAYWQNVTLTLLDLVTENSVSEKTYGISLKTNGGDSTSIGKAASSLVISAFELAPN